MIKIEIFELNKGLKEIIISDKFVNFYFFNNKPSISVSRDDVSGILNDKYIEFTNLLSNEFIGRAYKRNIKKNEMWDQLLTFFI